MPSSIPRFARYAEAFEKSYASDDWSHVEPFFTEDAVYDALLPPPLGGRFTGRDAIRAYFQRVLDGFDRRFASRAVSLVAGPREQDDWVWIRGRARYSAPGRIRRLEDRYDEATLRALESHLREHGAALGLGIEERR